jgi:hypothetical protein
MNLDPDVVRSKPRSVIFQWLRYAAADALFDEWQSEVANFEMQRAMGRPN